MLTKKIFTVLIILCSAITSMAHNLKIKVYNPGSDALFQVTSTLIYGDKDAILIDAQFQKQYAEQLVEEIKATKKNLKMVYISHSDPDFYFGLEVIKKAFPNVQIISTAQTAYLISASKDEKLAVWGPKLKSDAPSEIIIPTAVRSIPDLEGNKIEIVQNPDDPAHSFLWIPSSKTVVGGISVSLGTHLWMTDTQNEKALNQWISQIDKMKSLNPKQIVPSHYLKQDFSPQCLDFIKNYLENYKKVVNTNHSSDSAIQAIQNLYPNLPGRDALAMGIKVFYGELAWNLKSPMPAIGRKLVVDLDSSKYILNFKDNRTLSYLAVHDSHKDNSVTVHYTVTEIAKNTFIIHWHEPVVETNVSLIKNFDTMKVYTILAEKDGGFHQYNGSFKLLD